MPKSINFTLPQSEILKFNAWIKSNEEKNTRDCQRIIKRAADETVSKAKIFADFPGKWSHGFLRGTIGLKGFSDTGMRAEVKAGGTGAMGNVKYAPFVEFGTGDFVKVNKDLVDYAIQFKGKGIRKVNLIARPYFFPALRLAWNHALIELRNIGFK